MKLRRTVISFAVLGLGIAAISAHAADAHIYNTKTGEVINATFNGGVFATHGKLTMQSEQHHLNGDWSIVRDGDAAWGSVYAMSGSQSANAFGNSTRRSLTARGRASAAGDGLYLRCEFETYRRHGNGACQDNQGGIYDLQF
jgi:hypothetical protein